MFAGLNAGGAPSGAGFNTLKAAADYLGNGAIEVNMYESEILDIVRRESVLRQRIDSRPSTGNPHRYFEETAIGVGLFSDPRNIQSTVTPTSPTRVERSAFIKAITNQVNLSLFDVQVTQQQGMFTGLEAKDIEDCVNGVILACASAYWVGSDTSLSAPTTLQYMGLLNQITLQSTIAPGASIIDGLKKMVATMMGNQVFKPRPTGIYMTPVLAHYIDTEAKAGAIQLPTVLVAGVQVNAIQTQAGPLPIITDVFIPAETGAAFGFSAPPAGTQLYFAVIVTEKLIERPYVDGAKGNPNPQLFRLGLQSGLQGQYVAVQFDAIVAKGPSYAHAVVAVQRP